MSTDSYKAAWDADKRWQEKLVEIYGSAASEARYDSRGHATPELAELRDEFLRLASLMGRNSTPAS